jgi:hypothetical protein
MASAFSSFRTSSSSPAFEQFRFLSAMHNARPVASEGIRSVMAGQEHLPRRPIIEKHLHRRIARVETGFFLIDGYPHREEASWPEGLQ